LPPIFRRRAAGAAQQFLPGFGNRLGNRFDGSFDFLAGRDRRCSFWLAAPAPGDLTLDGWALKPWLLRHRSLGLRLLCERRFAGRVHDSSDLEQRRALGSRFQRLARHQHWPDNSRRSRIL
jgi:hypothetical protein